MFGVFAGVFADVLAGTTEVFHDLSGVLHCFTEIQPVCISISRSRHEAILLESCLRAKLATLQGFSAAAVIPHLTRVVAMSRGRGGRVSTPKRSGMGRSGPGSSEASTVFAVLLYFLVYFW